ncbi:hypothetical protein [Floricoccus penangensis]|uniref:hypothetical protein n=1 Tax=Floricoccus penangensis TaxID=1859475 RepID=UPI00203ECD1F|nr:hypothetical protein [Floricoccus penangensis]URZ88064.1 hypothetical protein KIW23_03255 [Floricoccus penangensis]
MQEKEIYFKKAKFWNMVCLVLEFIGVLSGLYSLYTLFTANHKDYKELGEYGDKMSQYLASPLNRGISIISLVISIILLVMYFKANNKLKNEIIPSKLPYYCAIIWSVLSVIINLLITPDMGSVGEMGNFVIIIGIVSMIVGLAIAIVPQLMTLRNLFKLDSED